jgi:hypothetical protein
LRQWQESRQPDPAVLVASDNGLGILRPVSGKYDWQRTLGPSSCVAIADLDRDGRDEIIVGKRDGWLLVLSEKGEVKEKVLVGDEIRSIVTWPSQPGRLWIATGTDIRLLDSRLSSIAKYDCKAQRIEALGKDLVLILGEDGVVSAFRPDEQQPK